MEVRQSAFETYFQCQKKYEYTYIDGYEPKYATKEMQFGTGCHYILEQCYKGTPFTEADWSQWPLDELAKKKAALLLAAHLKHYPVPEDVLGAEIKFSVQIPGLAEPLQGTFDGIRRTSSGEVVVVEHKTTGTDLQFSDAYWDKLKASNWQVGLYQLAAMAEYNTNNVSVLYNVMRVPNFKLTKRESEAEHVARVAADIDENPGKYFAQARVKWTVGQLGKLLADLKDTVEEISTKKKFLRSRQCYPYQRSCPFYATCYEDEPLTNENLYKLRTHK